MTASIQIEVTDPVGLYLTPTNALVNTANRFNSDIRLQYSQKEVNLKSMMAVISLGVPNKALLTIKVNGDDEQAVIEEMKKVIISSDIGVILR